MSDEMAEKLGTPEFPRKDQTPEGRSVTLSITLQPNGQIDFSLPLNNKILCYGLLECARAQVDKLYLIEEQKQAQAKALAARGGLAGLRQRMNGG